MYKATCCARLEYLWPLVFIPPPPQLALDIRCDHLTSIRNTCFCADDVVSLEGGATFIAPLDSGFVAASNRTVEDMLEEIQDASDESLTNWLGQWAIPTRIDTVSRQGSCSQLALGLQFHKIGPGPAR